MNENVLQQMEQASAYLRRRISDAGHAMPRVAVVLGSGLGDVADSFEKPCIVPYAEIPHFPHSTVPGHAGRMIFGSVQAVPVALLQGRVHGYEGYSADEIVLPIRVLGALGVTQAILTNAAGSMRRDLTPGSLVALSDHINLTGTNPCTGPNDARLGPRFFDMTHAYSKRLRQLAVHTAAEQGWQMREGVYLSVPGPSFETPAEIRFFQTVGADMVGMSTVLEVIAARHMGIEVLALSCITNLAAGIGEAELSHTEVMETGVRVSAQLTTLLAELLPKMSALQQ